MTSAPPMRVAIVSHAHPSVSKGGAEIAAYTLFRGLQDLGVPSLFIAAVPQAALDRVSLASADEHVLPYDPAQFDHVLLLGRPAMSTALVRLLRDQNASVINFHHYLNFGIGAVRQVKAQTGLPVVFTLHEYLAICAHHGQMITRPARNLCEAASPEACAACFPEHGREGMTTRRDLMFDVLSRCDGFVSPSRFLIDRYVAWGLPAEKFSLIENGLIDTAPPPERAPRSADDPITFAYFGQINPFKGVDVLLNAVDSLAARPDLAGRFRVRIHGNVIGVTPAFEQRLARAIETYDFLEVPGPYDNRQVRRLMSAADYVMVPSTWWENSPVVIQEAYAARRPVICSGIGGMAEKVVDGVTGHHFRVGDAKDLARVMEGAIKEAGRPERQAALARPSSHAEMAKEYLSCLNGASTPEPSPTPSKKAPIHRQDEVSQAMNQKFKSSRRRVGNVVR
ncbi:glycosyltransferase family 4 protein [Neotabrizicola shimadae]|uniref:Glycosyltransferase family 4 protein n=1 Tax=Neotabrizicola shimadae TaxID=2807096 RepID=A0A8G0ZXU3_9RHOB|nr:glycosyltransferase family 4 protein [Neotabrizicola shimadae]QYZ70044.1 glycosyltransferase family 4 protein [Neotabrizicola shimadae]